MPARPLPAPVRGSDPGSFAQLTVTRRMPASLQRTLQVEAFLPEARTRLEALLAELPAGAIRSLQDPTAPDQEAWNAWIAPYLGETWLSLPWFVGETYFFRRILEAAGYFQPGPSAGRDPFARQKAASLAGALPGVARWAQAWPGPGELEDALTGALHQALWSNQADLHLFPDGQTPPESGLLVDDTPRVVAHLLARAAPRLRVDIVLDNCGLELISDLRLADLLLTHEIAGQVRLHAKAYPTFVSDATPADIDHTLAELAGAGLAEAAALAARMQNWMGAGALHVDADPFWTSPLAWWEMPPGLFAHLAGSALLLVKGDANYRRLLGDRQWPADTPFAAVVAHPAAPLAALRVLKSEVIAGLPAGLAAEMANREANWRTNGRWGVVQFTELPAQA